MVSFVSPRILDYARHLALADIALELHLSRLHQAVLHAVAAAVCIVVLGVGCYIAKKILSKGDSDLHFEVTLKRKNRRTVSRGNTKRVVRSRNPSRSK